MVRPRNGVEEKLRRKINGKHEKIRCIYNRTVYKNAAATAVVVVVVIVQYNILTNEVSYHRTNSSLQQNRISFFLLVVVTKWCTAVDQLVAAADTYTSRHRSITSSVRVPFQRSVCR